MSGSHQHDDKAHDQAFVRTFGMVLAALFGIFAFCIFAARLIVPETKPTEAVQAKLVERLSPVGKVITDPALLAKPKVARAAYTGEEVVAKVCGNCHNAGVLGAPKTGDKAAWAGRGSLDAMVASAIKGKNAMPARGGDPDLSDEEIKLAVELMTK